MIRVRMLVAAATFALCFSTAGAQAPTLRPGMVAGGSLVIIGGNGATPAIWDRFMELAGGDSAVIVYFPTASAGDIDTTDNSSLRTWRERKPKSAVIMHTRSRDTANTEAFVAPLRKATGVWFGGGVQSRITDAYLGTKTEEALKDVLRRGGVVGGTSAGAAIMTEVMITGGNPEATLGKGFGLLPGSVADQHFTQRNRQPRLVGVVAKHPGLVGFGIDEATALIVHNSRSLEVLGRGRVNVIFAATATAPVDSTLWREASAVAASAARDSTTRAAGRRASPPKVFQGELPELIRKAQQRVGGRQSR